MSLARNSENFLHAHMPYTSAVTDTILRTYDGDLITSMEVQGLTASMSDDREVDAAMQNFDMMLQTMNPRCGIYIHKIINDAKPLHPNKSTNNAFANAIDQRWYAHLNASGLKTRKIIVTFCIRPNLGVVSAKKIFGNIFKNNEAHVSETFNLIAELRSIAKHFEAIVTPRKCTNLKLSDGTLLGFMGKLVGRRASIILPAKTSGPITAPIVADRYHFQGDYFIIKEQNDKHRYGRIMSIKNYCPNTWATILDRLEMPMDMVITNSYTPCSTNKAKKMLKHTDIAMESAEDNRLSDQAKLIEAKDDLVSRRIGFGKHHFSVTIFQDTLESLDDLTSITRANCEEVGLTMVSETTFAKESFFA
ncbi:MAG: hypothetical protein QM488_16480, partial [Rhizobiaceae bacterium]